MTVPPEIPGSDELGMLPRWAGVALAIRCAWRLLARTTPWSLLSFHPMIVGPDPRVRIGSFEEALELADDLAANRPTPYPAEWIEGFAAFLSNGTHDIPALGVFGALLAAARAALAAKGSAANYEAEVRWVVYTIPEGHLTYSEEEAREIRRDYNLLIRIAKEQKWNDTTPVAQDFFSLYSDFEITDARNDRRIIEVGTFVKGRLFEYFQRHPEHLYSLSPRTFEELIADLFAGFGYQVELTQRTRDGGRDIIAIENSIVKNKYLLECKRYKKSARVGVELVRQLHGVVVDEGATKGILVTTGRFTKGAIAHFNRHPWLLEGRDLEGLLHWLKEYQRFRMEQVARQSN